MLSSAAGNVPIYGLAQIPLKKSTVWDILPPSNSAVQSLTWQGDDPFSVSFSFILTAGIIQEAQTRDDLFNLIKYFHAMLCFVRGQDGFAQPPPPVQLIIGNYINCKGILRSGTATPSRPWSTDLKPTTCTFEVDFLSAPSYDGKLVTMGPGNGTDAFDSKTVASQFYKA